MKLFNCFLFIFLTGLLELIHFPDNGFTKGIKEIKHEFSNGKNHISSKGNVALQDSSAAIFMQYLKSNWDDIHDVIMRYHCDNPDLRGTVEIEMEWINGKLTGALVQSNTTGNAEFGQSLIHAMQEWTVQGLPSEWVIVVPFKTQIYGSKNPAFKEYGIFTGKVIRSNGLPVKKARIILNPALNGEEADTLYANREGIFIKTLLKPGKWEVICQAPEGEYIKDFQINISAGEHIQKMIEME